MSQPTLITVVVPAYNPGPPLLETLASVEAQTHAHWEVVVVDDGSDREESLRILADIEGRGDARIRVVRQENRGLAGARNTGFREARGAYVIPLDADDQLGPTMMAACLAEIEAHPDAGFVYSDWRVFGDKNYVETAGEFNFYRLLNENFLTHCCLVPQHAWETAGGYDERHRWGYEDWSFYIGLAKHGFFGLYIPEPLFRYRLHGRGLHFSGLDRHEANWRFMEERHPEVLRPEGRLRVKREWAPSICVVATGGAPDLSNQTLRDYQLLRNVTEAEALAASSAPAFFWIAGGGVLHPQALEQAVLALQDADWVTWRDTGDAPPPSVRAAAGPLGLSRAALERPEANRTGEVRRIQRRCRLEGRGSVVEVVPDRNQRAPKSDRRPGWPSALARIERHLLNAELLSVEAWTRHPLRSAARLIPLRAKERVNAWAGRDVFDLSFYLQFQPRSAAVRGKLIEPVDYLARPARKKRRVGLITPHLSYGGAETVLLELARQIDRDDAELVVIATHRGDKRLQDDWADAADWVVDLAELGSAESAPRLLLSVITAWDLDVLVLQNSAFAYAVLPAWKERRPDGKAVDVLHAVDADWDFFSSTLDVADHLDARVVISEQGRRRLEEMATPEEKIHLIANGVDMERFDPHRFDYAALRKKLRVGPRAKVIVFLGRLTDVKRPLLLPEIFREMERADPKSELVMAVGGSGPLEEQLRARVHAAGLERSFRLLGHINDPAGLLAVADALVMPSEAEGVPLTLLEAMAMGVPVVASRAGAIEEELTPETGVLVEPGADEHVRFGQALAELLADEERRQAMSAAGRAIAREKHSLERAREGYAKLMAETLASVERTSALGAATPRPPRAEVSRGEALGKELNR